MDDHVIKSEIKIVPLEKSDYRLGSMDVHPTEPWILIVVRRNKETSIIIWDYNTQASDFSH